MNGHHKTQSGGLLHPPKLPINEWDGEGRTVDVEYVIAMKNWDVTSYSYLFVETQQQQKYSEMGVSINGPLKCIVFIATHWIWERGNQMDGGGLIYAIRAILRHCVRMVDSI